MELTYGCEKQGAYISSIINAMNIKDEEKDLLNEYIRQNGFAYLMQPLTPREQSIFTARSEGIKLREIAKKFDVTGNRIMQIEHKLRFKISKRLEILLARAKSDKTQYYFLCEEEKKLVIALKERIPQLQHLLDFLNKLEPISESNSQETIPMVIESTNLDKGIDEIGLSVRAYNCLVRHMCNYYHFVSNDKITLKDLSQLTKHELMCVRNLGRKSFIEIIRILSSYGVELKEY